MDTRAIPRSGERIPVIGLGTWSTFDVADETPLREVMKRFLAAGGTVIDSSPMYGRAEEVVGKLGPRGAFIATKVWTSGQKNGIAEMERSIRRMGGKVDLMQIHNLLDTKTHLPVLREWKAAGRIRYIGITHYAHSAFGELERLMETEALDFVQLPYNAVDRAAEARLLPAAASTKTAVLVMRPLGEGALLQKVKSKPLPSFAQEIDCTSWAQILLKFIVSHPAVTCAIPATSSAEHLSDNVKAGSGRMPDEALRKRISGEF